MTATEASRKFSALLDLIEEKGEPVIITRDGKSIARMEPEGVRQPNGARINEWVEQRAASGEPPAFGDDFLQELQEMRELLLPPRDPWEDA